MSSIRNKRSVRWLCIGAGAILLLCVAAVLFLLPRLINKEIVKEKIVHLLSQKIAGTVTFQDADISLFPLPRVIIRNASLTIPEKVIGTIKTLTVFPELRPLFSGHVRLSKIQIDEPVFHIHLPPKKEDTTPTLDEIAGLLRSLTLGSADIRLRLDRGSITLEKSGHAPASLKEIGLSLDLTNTNDGVAVTIDRLSSKDPGLFLSATFRVNPAQSRFKTQTYLCFLFRASSSGMQVLPSLKRSSAQSRRSRSSLS